MNSKKLKIIAEFGKVYQKKCLYYEKTQEQLQNSLKQNWYEALKFFFSKSFMQGRRDEISIDFLRKTIQVLDRLNFERNLLVFTQNENWEIILEKELKEGGVNKQTDRRMVISTIKLILKLNDYNLINYSLGKIQSQNIEEIYRELLDELPSVGHKIASFFLRDLVCVFNLNLPPEQQIFLQPIDTWVGHVLEKFNITQSCEIDEIIKKGNKRLLWEIRRRIIKKCQDAQISSIGFNQGSWYIGKHAFDILLENLDKISKKRVDP